MFKGVFIACLALCVVLPTSHVRAESYSFSDEGWEGTSELLRIAKSRLGAERVDVAEVLDWDALTPEDGLLILFPARDLDYGEALAFLRAGGRLALLDDYGRAESLLERFKIHRVNAPSHPSHMVRGNRELAVAVPSVQVIAGQEQGRHPIVDGVAQIVTNHPTGLTHPNLTPVLGIPAQDEPDVTLAVTGIIADKGRLLAMGDPSAVINLMLRYGGNRAFVEGLIDYLVEDDSWGEREGRLYLLSNDFRQSGSFEGRSSLVNELSDHFAGAQDVLASFHTRGIPDPVALVLAAVVALGVIAWVGSTSTRLYRRISPRFARATQLVAQGGAAGRVALLAAPTTHRALALLELKSALEEGLAERLGLTKNASEAELLAEIDRQRALSQSSSALLGRMLLEFRQAEVAVVASQPFRVTTKMVERMHSEVESILREATARREASR